MITFIDEEKETSTGSDWIEITSQHSDICLISVGKVDFDETGHATTDYANFACTGPDIFKLYEFSLNSSPGNSLTLAWDSEDGNSYQKITITNSSADFMLSVEEGGHNDDGDFREIYCSTIRQDTFLQACREMHELYLSVNEKSS